MEPKMVPGIYLGQDENQGCCIVYDLRTNKIVHTKDVDLRQRQFTHAAALRINKVGPILDTDYVEEETPLDESNSLAPPDTIEEEYKEGILEQEPVAEPAPI